MAIHWKSACDVVQLGSEAQLKELIGFIVADVMNEGSRSLVTNNHNDNSDNRHYNNNYNPNYNNYNPNYNPNPPAPDNGGFLWGLLGCCIPLVGLILFLVWKDQKPRTAKAAGIGALVGVGLVVVWYILVFAIGIGSSLMY